MTHIGITGHQELPAEAVPYIITHVQRQLRGLAGPLIGFSSLAEGADQLVADLILEARGKLHVVIPASGYEATFDDKTRDVYARLLAAADRVTELSSSEPGEKAYYAAGKWVVEHCDLLIAIWDGQPARGLGGTADAVAYARDIGKEVRVVWPDGVER